MSHTVHVANIAPATDKKHLEDFFTFCGKITTIDFNESARSASVHFEKSSAAKTALMLNGGTLDGSTLAVTSEVEHQDEIEVGSDGIPYHQSDKPRAGIAAEYLARGYTLSDQILQRAIDMDNQHGISKRFLSYIQSLDTQVGARAIGPDATISVKVSEGLAAAHTRAKSIDEQKGITKTATDYYAWATGTPFGQKVKQFYTTTSKQVFDIHEEAKRIAAQQKPTIDVPEKAAPVQSMADQVAAAEAGQAGPATNAPTVV